MPLSNIVYTPGQDSMQDFFDKINLAIDKINDIDSQITGGTEDEVLTKTSGTNYDYSWEAIPSKYSDKKNINIVATSIQTINTETPTTITNGVTSLTIVLPNDSVVRTLLFIVVVAYENDTAETSIIRTRIYDGSSTLIEAYTDLREDQDDCVIHHLEAAVTCSGQTISVQSRYNSSGSDSAYECNGGSLIILEV
jgi:hypothetical protein